MRLFLLMRIDAHQMRINTHQYAETASIVKKIIFLDQNFVILDS